MSLAPIVTGALSMQVQGFCSSVLDGSECTNYGLLSLLVVSPFVLVQVQLSVREGRKLGGTCKLFFTNPIFKNCSSGKLISTGLSSRYHCGFNFAA
ncbi:hypothetical protein IGI04_007146, partial [Brassica rapa subsp. trilocularis]